MAISNLSFRHATEGSNEESAFDFAALTSLTWGQPPRVPHVSHLLRDVGISPKAPQTKRRRIQTFLWPRWPFRICHSDTRPKGATRNLLLTSPPHPPQHRDNRGRAALHRRMK